MIIVLPFHLIPASHMIDIKEWYFLLGAGHIKKHTLVVVLDRNYSAQTKQGVSTQQPFK